MVNRVFLLMSCFGGALSFVTALTIKYKSVFYHLTTLFPEVRLRGFLEIRSVDALPERWRAVPVVLLAAIIVHAERAR